MKKKITVLVTGATSGIGRSICYSLLKKKHYVVGVGRTLSELKIIKERFSNLFTYIKSDLSLISDRESVVSFLDENQINLTHVIHNAGEINPICSMSDISIDDYRYQHLVNVEAPLFLTQSLLPKISHHGRFMFVTSGAAFNPYKGLATYSISKAATEMVWKTFQQEYKDKPYYFCGVRPGGVKTKMLLDSMNISSDIFPAITVFKEKINKGEILEPDYVANFLEWILLFTSNEEFEQSWNINNNIHYQKWVGSKNVRLEGVE